ncbi:MAG: AAA family ATPase [Bacteroidales bacterium]|nr:AAA family ATPase [Bacteroidales bacterium]
MGKTIAIVNQKGGVGKTTTTFNLGACLAEQGKKVLLVDLDQQGNLTYCMGHDVPDEVEETIAQLMLKAIADEEYNPHYYVFYNRAGTHIKENGEMVPYQLDYICCNVMMSTVEVSLVNAMSREQVLKYILEELKEKYDYILLDCGPSLGMITINALVAADSVLIPLQAEKFASLGLELLLKNILRVKRRLNPALDIEGILFVAVPEKYKESKKTVDEVTDKFGSSANIYDYIIPRLTEVTKAIRKQIPMIQYEDKVAKIKKGESIVAGLYRRLAKEVMENGR